MIDDKIRPLSTSKHSFRWGKSKSPKKKRKRLTANSDNRYGKTICETVLRQAIARHLYGPLSETLRCDRLARLSGGWRGDSKRSRIHARPLKTSRGICLIIPSTLHQIQRNSFTKAIQLLKIKNWPISRMLFLYGIAECAAKLHS